MGLLGNKYQKLMGRKSSSSMVRLKVQESNGEKQPHRWGAPDLEAGVAFMPDRCGHHDGGRVDLTSIRRERNEEL